MKQSMLTILGGLVAVGLHAQAFGGTVNLGTARQFAVLGGSTVTNTDSSVITGDLGVWPGMSVTGFPPGIVNGVKLINDAIAQQAQSDARSAFTTLAGFASTQNLTGQDLGGMTLTLDAQGDPNAVFVFQMGSTLTTASNSAVTIINGLNAFWGNVFWQVGSSATLGTETDFLGTIIAETSITLNTGVLIVDERALSVTGPVTLDPSIIGVMPIGVMPIGVTPVVIVPVPPAAAMGLAGCGAACMARRRRVGLSEG